MRFSNSGGGEKAPAARKKSSASQTRWELKDKEVQVAGLFSNSWRQKPDFLNLGAQVLPKDLDSGDGDEWTDWRGQPTVNNGTQVALKQKLNDIKHVVHQCSFGPNKSSVRNEKVIICRLVFSMPGTFVDRYTPTWPTK